jgi:hypothetical protein
MGIWAGMNIGLLLSLSIYMVFILQEGGYLLI